jgi:hypothetical protein
MSRSDLLCIIEALYCELLEARWETLRVQASARATMRRALELYEMWST